MVVIELYVGRPLSADQPAPVERRRKSDCFIHFAACSRARVCSCCDCWVIVFLFLGKDNHKQEQRGVGEKGFQ